MEMNRDELFGELEFFWRVTDAGYDWVTGNRFDDSKPDAVGEESQILVVARDTIIEQGYYPLQSALGLFRSFADLEFDPGSILKFANQFGLLGIDQTGWVVIGQDGGKIFYPPSQAESSSVWFYQIALMKHLVNLWDVIRMNDRKELNSRMQWQDSTRIWFRGWKYSREIPLPDSTRKIHGEIIAPFIREDLEPVSKSDVLKGAQVLLNRWVSLQLLNGFGVRLIWNSRTNRPVLRVVPENLLLAMWLQFAQAIQGNLTYRQCKTCSRWFSIAKGEEPGFRINRLFCTDSCKSKDYRDTKQQAIELHRNGKSLEAIAKQLDKPLATIRTWVKAKKDKP